MDNLLRNIIAREKVFGIDITNSSIRIIQFETKKDYFVLKSIAEEEIPITSFVAGVIRQKDIVAQKLIASINKAYPKKITTKFAVVLLPDDQIYTQIIKLPKVEKNKIEKAIAFQLSSFIPMKEDEVYWDFAILSEDANNYEIIINAVGKESADSFINTLNIAGITPLVFESRSQAALRAIKGHNKTEEEYMLIDIGKSITNIAITKKDAIQFSSSVFFGVNQIIKVIGEYNKINDDKIKEILEKDGVISEDTELQKHIDSLFIQPLQEMQKAINYYGEEKIAKVYLYGDGAQLKGVLDKFQSQTNVKTEIAGIGIKIFPILQWEKHEKISPYISIIGIEMINKIKDLIYINILPKKQKSIGIRNFIKKQTLGLLKFILIDLVILSVGMLYLSYQNTLSIQNTKNVIQTYIQANNNPKYKGLNAKINTLNTELSNLSNAYKTQYKWSKTIQEIANLIPSGITLNQFKIQNTAKAQSSSTLSVQPVWQITLGGVAQTGSLVVNLANTLEKENGISNVEMPISNFQSSHDANFTITFNINPQ
jgi:type IV pilus assembly protein PilM